MTQLSHQSLTTIEDVMVMDGEARRVAAAVKRLSTAAE
jgi:hypothetical protein